jgi:zinc/manganese transport system substrate-binding protein
MTGKAGVGALLLVCLGGAALTGCGATELGASNVGRVRVVVAEDFWGSIAAQVGGGHVRVTSILAEPNADPHSYEPSSTDARTVADAQYVIINGAGYDQWAANLLAASPVAGRKELNVGTLVGKKDGDNPHLWYNPDYVAAVVDRIRDDLKALDPADVSAFDASARAFLTTGLAQYHGIIAEIKAKYGGTAVGATESIFSYLAPALGLDLITPYSYLKAVSEGAEISAADEATVEQQIAQQQIKVLVSNAQNTPNNIQAVISLAEAQHIPIATITETLSPAGATFQAWQSAQLQGIAAALARATGE